MARLDSPECHVYPWDPLGNIHLLLQNHSNFQRMEVVQYSLLLLALFSYAVIIFVQINNEETFTVYTHNP